MRLIKGDYEKAVSYCREMIKGEFFEFDFPFVPMNEHFREIDRFLWESKHQCTRFENRFEGRAVIDISDWNRHYPNDYFDAFMYFMKDNEAYVSCTLISSEPWKSEVTDRLEKLFEVKEVDLSGGESSKKSGNVIGFAVDFEKGEKDNV